MKQKKTTNQTTWREKLHEIIYEAETPLGKWFDIVLILLIIISVLLVMLESVRSFDEKYHGYLVTAEWVITLFFTVEYIVRIICIPKPSKYIFSLYGIVDFLSTIPLYFSFFVSGTHVLITIRILRLLRIFRILKLIRFIGEAQQLKQAIEASKAKILVFIYTVLIISVILGTVMYLIEGAEAGFTSIPRSIYWTIVTLTTVGYGDIAPVTAIGQVIATIVMILGYGIIAVPTGIVSVEFSKQHKSKNFVATKAHSLICQKCKNKDHANEALYCYNCGTLLNE